MPAYSYSHTHKAFVKQCSCCKTITVGTKDQQESYKIFEEVFSRAATSAGMADALQSRCWICNSAKRRQLGITRPILEQMFLDQKGKCKICERDLSIVRNADSEIHAHVDHDPNTGIVRSLLCGHCNRGIGLFFHKPDLLRQAAKYIESHTVEGALSER